MIVAIDGPAGVGKSTVARTVAETCGYFNMNTGSFYRAVTFGILKAGIRPDDENAVVDFARKSLMEIRDGRFFLNGVDVESELRADGVEAHVAPVSAIVEVRSIVNDQIRRIAENLDLVAEGRDMTTVVFPHGEVKVFLDADPEIRAQRRLDQGTSEMTLEELTESIRKRDEIDRNKPVGGLKISDDAVYIDTSHLTIDEVCSKVVSIIKEMNL